MIFIDSNVPIYLVGAAHPNKDRAQAAISSMVSERLVTDAEAFQELLHRYRAIDHRDGLRDAFETLAGLVDEVFTVDFQDVDAARTILLGRWQLSARDAIHVAVMKRRGVTQILSYDEDFDSVTGISRLS